MFLSFGCGKDLNISIEKKNHMKWMHIAQQVIFVDSDRNKDSTCPHIHINQVYSVLNILEICLLTQFSLGMS